MRGRALEGRSEQNLSKATEKISEKGVEKDRERSGERGGFLKTKKGLSADNPFSGF
tara:strand:+ start:516 stop:683 length:168 start_codon:yes stop_codon:yes gene_type:complete